MIRELGVSFDPRLHRAVAAPNPGNGESIVAEVLEPGFIEGGKIRQPAKVILGRQEHEREFQQQKQEKIEL